MKRNHILILIGITLIVAGAMFAEQQLSAAASANATPGTGCRMGQGGGPGNGMGHGPGGGGCCIANAPDMAKSTTFFGQVKSFEGGPGKGRPTLILATAAGDKTFIVGPYRVLSDSKVEFVPGHAWTVTAAPNVNNDWVAITIKDDATGTEVVLRDTNGRPAGGGCRMGHGGGPGNGMGRGFGGNGGSIANAPDMTKRTTFFGEVKSFEGGPGNGRPTLILATAAGDKTFIVGPYRVLSDSKVEFVPGHAWTVTAAPNVNNDWVAIAIKNDVTGTEVLLRDTSGRPAGGGCRGPRS